MSTPGITHIKCETGTSVALAEADFPQGPLRSVIEAYLRSQSWQSYDTEDGVMWGHNTQGYGKPFIDAVTSELNREWRFPGHEISGRYEPVSTSLFVPMSVRRETPTNTAERTAL